MKVAIGSKFIDGPWGGGNLFVKSLKDYLENKKVSVVHNLNVKDIDIILLTEPRVESSSSSITLLEAKLYKKYINNNVKIIHRINECDERKNTNKVNKKMLHVSNNSDYTVFVSYWIRDLYWKLGLKKNNSKVIMSGSDKKIFNDSDYEAWDGSSKLKILTHHWGNDWNKGFDVYSKIDNLLDSEEFNKKFNFCYIGNLPKGFKFKNTDYKKPMSGLALAAEIKSHHLYITGSLNEPSGNHQIEASQCGLPVMYIKSGGITDYQRDYGIEFQIDNLENKLNEVLSDYELFFKKNLNFPYSAEKMNKDYFELFDEIQNKSDKNLGNNYYFLLYKFLDKLNFINFYKKLLSKLSYQLNKLNR